MRNTTLLSILSIGFFLFLYGCDKPKFESTPSLKFEKVNTDHLSTGQLLQFTLSFTDAEGDLTDSLYVEKYVPYCAGSSFGDWYALPAFPTTKNQKGELTVSFGYNLDGGYENIAPQCQLNDTAVFRFALRDKKQHISDTITSPPIIIIYQ